MRHEIPRAIARIDVNIDRLGGLIAVGIESDMTIRGLTTIRESLKEARNQLEEVATDNDHLDTKER